MPSTASLSATHDHFWDPLDKSYIDFDQPFDMSITPVMPLDTMVELRSAVADRLDDRQKIQLANDVMHWSISNLLHGEQGAMSLSASLCHILVEPGSAGIRRQSGPRGSASRRGLSPAISPSAGATRWRSARPSPRCWPDLVSTQEVYKKIVGMQMLIEGVAMGSFATLNAKTNDPVLRRLVQLVMSDEAFHHRFGRIWASKTIRHLNEEEHRKVEDWSAQIFQTLLFNLINTEQKQVIYAKYGLEWQWVRDAVKEIFSDDDRRAQLKEGKQYLPRADQDPPACRHTSRSARRRSMRCGST